MEKAAIGFVDEKHHWFKAACGWEMGDVPRPLTFCRHTIRSEEALVVPDAREVLGKSPRLLQGPDTDPKTLTRIRSAPEERKPIEVVLPAREGVPRAAGHA